MSEQATEAGVIPGFKICHNKKCKQTNPQPMGMFHKGRARCKACIRESDRNRYHASIAHKPKCDPPSKEPLALFTPENEEPYALIPLYGQHGQGLATKISLYDVDQVTKLRWYRNSAGYVYAYVGKNHNFKVVLLHRFLFGLNPSDGSLVDHEKGDKLDNRRSRLRVCTSFQNAANQKANRNTKSGYKGVYFNEKSQRWYAKIRLQGKIFWLGSYLSAVEAAETYDAAARYHFGVFARTNFSGILRKSANQIRQQNDERKRARQSSRFLGVCKLTMTLYRASLKRDQRTKVLGYFHDERQAAKAVDDELISRGLPPANSHLL